MNERTRAVKRIVDGQEDRGRSRGSWTVKRIVDGQEDRGCWRTRTDKKRTDRHRLRLRHVQGPLLDGQKEDRQT